MQLPQPLGYAWLTRTWTKWMNWTNTEIYRYRKLEIRKLDILLLILGCSIAVFYAVFYSWQWAVLGTLFYGMILMMCVWMF